MDPSTLRNRLRDIVARSARPFEEASSTAAPERSGPSIGDVLGGEWRERTSGRSFVVTRHARASQTHGRCRVGDLAEQVQSAAASAALIARAARPPFVFLDLETTGLSGGAGTYAFLIGCGWFDPDGSFVTEQHVMVDFGAERGMLGAVAEELSRAATLVTFNGKSFDAPVLDTRYLFHRLEAPCSALAHLDLLHPARRFWGGADEAGCSLVALEGRLLGARRHGDVPGFEIPARYFQFIRNGDARPLADVLEHNRLDLLSLAALTARLLHLVDRGPQCAEHAREAFALGQLFDRAGLEERAGAAYEHAAVRGSDPALLAGAYRALAVAARRGRRFDLAAARWRSLLDVPGCPAHHVREAVEALAIHHEHRARDLAEAKIFALKGLELDGRAARGDASRHRLVRIERKLASERRWPASPPLPLSSGSPRSGSRTSS